MKGTDREVLLLEEGHQEVADVAQLGRYCIDEPVKSPLDVLPELGTANERPSITRNLGTCWAAFV